MRTEEIISRMNAHKGKVGLRALVSRYHTWGTVSEQHGDTYTVRTDAGHTIQNLKGSDIVIFE